MDGVFLVNCLDGDWVGVVVYDDNEVVISAQLDYVSEVVLPSTEVFGWGEISNSVKRTLEET